MAPSRPLLVACALVAALAGLLAGCGSSVSHRTPPPAGVPLIGGAQVLASVRRCDRGASAYCAVQMVIADPQYGNSTELLIGERHYLQGLGWTVTNADTGDEHAADSPGHKLRLTYATAALELKDVDLGWVQRARVIAHALSRAMFGRQAALSLMLETGSS
ncbi:MAG: hypothetical protein ACR2GZ_02075 [Solirubrobacteraceae bacterium]